MGAVPFWWRNWPVDSAYRVGLAFGDCMFVNHGLLARGALEQVGYADERAFSFYHADGDLALRMAEHGSACILSEVAYPGSDDKALDGISFRADPGQTIALVGHSGAGKSTIARLMLRFHDPVAGHVRIDEVDLKNIPVSSLRDNMALLLQETLMFDGTIRENIAYGRPAATDEEIVAAAEAADAHEFIDELEGGYDAEVGQRGRRLSGGQRQRVAIARAMIRDAPILILDEPRTGLDAESSQKIPRAAPAPDVVAYDNRYLARAAHRPRGRRDPRSRSRQDHRARSHDELMTRNGAYTRCVRLQIGAREARDAFSGA